MLANREWVWFSLVDEHLLSGKIIKDSKIPRDWKKYIPIFKKGNGNFSETYSTITLFSAVINLFVKNL